MNVGRCLGTLPGGERTCDFCNGCARGPPHSKLGTTNLPGGNGSGGASVDQAPAAERQRQRQWPCWSCDPV